MKPRPDDLSTTRSQSGLLTTSAAESPARSQSVMANLKRPAGALVLRTGAAPRRALPGWQPAEPPIPRHAFLPPSSSTSDPL